MAQRLLSSDNIIDAEPIGNSAEELRQSRLETRRLEDELRKLRGELEQAIADKERMARAIRALQGQLNPLHRYLRALFGEIELAVGEEQVGPENAVARGATSPSTTDPRWESYKNTFPGAPARVIDALLAHREMTMTQLSALLKAHYNTVKDAVGKLIKAGAVSRDGGICRLNQ